jgi:hypothetical protein
MGVSPAEETEQSMATQVSAVVCAWCSRIVFDAPAGAGISHTICPSCFDWTMAHPESQTGRDDASELAALNLPAGYFGDRLS